MEIRKTFKKISLGLFLVSVICFNLVENKSMYGIGIHIAGEQLLVKDVLSSLPSQSDIGPRVHFSYNIPEPITYLEISSEKSILGNVSFSFVNDIVKGSVETENEPFEVLIRIYGFDVVNKNVVHPSLTLNHNNYDGFLKPSNEEEGADDTEYDFDENGSPEYEAYTNTKDPIYLEPLEGTSDELEFESKDKIIEIGHRQKDDILLYQTYQSSMDSKNRTNHSVTFYYIDENFITNIRFVLFDHFESKTAMTPGYKAPLVEYSFYSPKTLKAAITDYNTTSLFVEIFVYGYTPKEVPDTYTPFMALANGQNKVFFREIEDDSTERPLTPLQRIKHLDELHPDVQVVCPEPTPTVCPSSGFQGKSNIFMSLLLWLLAFNC